MQPQFVHLRVHTEFSISDGLIRVKPLVKQTAARGMPAVAMTDLANLFALIKFYRAALGEGVKPIIGADLWVQDPDEPDKPFRMPFLARNDEGYRNLKRLMSRGYKEGQVRGKVTVKREWIAEEPQGLICLSGGKDGDVGRALLAGNLAEAERLARRWSKLFDGDFYLELNRLGRPGDEEHVHAAVALADELELPVVATNDVRFLDADDFAAHEARVCIQEGRVLDDPRRPRIYTEQQYLRSAEEMAELFADIPEALANSVSIAQRCTVKLRLGKNFLPDFPIPEGMTEAEFFIEESKKGLEKRLDVLLDRNAPDFEEQRKPYDERLMIELGVINQMGFPGYFLIVADFIQWAKDNAIPVGPGRGSGAGSLVAYALSITDLDPLAYDLLFERFLNPERVSMPDFDVDFCMDNRDKVIDYVARTYGRDKVSQIATHGTMAAKAVVRDVGRVMGQAFGFVDRIAKLIPFEIGMTLEKALDEEDELRKLRDEDEEVKEILDMAMALEGLARNVGKHAGGVVIAPTELTDFSPIYKESEESPSVVTQFDKDDVEAAGLVKFDFLGLRTLTIIDWAVQNVNSQLKEGEEKLDIATIALDEPEVFALLKRAETTAVFQLESRGMKQLIERLKPDCFEDIVALVALFRPGPLQSGMVDDFIARKHGRAKVEYPHPDLEPILKPTYGIILYQEQVMQIAQVLANYSLGGADLLRRAMGKKKPAEMEKQRGIFMEGSGKRGVDPDVATYIFDLMEKFAGYGFNKSHSAAYALVSYQTAWMKYHHPAAFMAAVLSSDMDNTEKVVVFIEECREMGLKVQAPDVNRSDHMFTTDGLDTVVYGLGAIKGVGEAAIEGIIEERRENGPYKDLFDFCQRIDLRKANKRVMEALIRAGALDSFSQNRATLDEWLPTAFQIADQKAKAAEQGQDDLFGLGNPVEAETTSMPDLPPHQEWPDDQRLGMEKDVLGLFLTGHPVSRYLDELDKFTSARLGKIGDLIGGVPAPGSNDGDGGRRRQKAKKVVAAGLIIGIRVMKQRNGKVAFLTLDDRSGRVEVRCFERVYEQFRNVIGKDTLIAVEGKLSYDDYNGGFQVTAEHIHSIEQARSRFAKSLELHIAREQLNSGNQRQLLQLLSPHRSEQGLPIRVKFRGESADASLRFSDDWRVNMPDEALTRLAGLFGESQARLVYSD